MNLWRVFHIFFIVVSLAPVVLTVSRLIEIIRIAGRQRTSPRWAIHLWPSGFLARHSEAPADCEFLNVAFYLSFRTLPRFRISAITARVVPRGASSRWRRIRTARSSAA